IMEDNYRAAHPFFEDILRLDERRCVQKTASDVGGWVKRLLTTAIKNRRNIVLEDEMSNGDLLINVIDRLRDEGYRVDVLVMAVGSEVSRLGILERCEGQREDGGYGLWTNLELHNRVYAGIPEAVKRVEVRGRVESVGVYNRAGEILYKNVSRDGVYTKPFPDAYAAIMKERGRSLSQEEETSIREGCKELLAKMKRRGASPGELAHAMSVLGNTRQLRRELEGIGFNCIETDREMAQSLFAS
ncbi:MAG: zeta toxin family protein, partial [Synergistaceae bacterium]|nr:zeta toxin family protein [Synergistaceae bacterium]